MRVGLVVTDDFSVWQFRRGLIRSLQDRGCEVYAICSDGEYVARLLSLGVIHVPVDFGQGIRPHRDLALLWKLVRIFRAYHFDLISTFTIKPNIYGTIAARLASVKRVVAQVSGRGSPFMDRSGLGSKILRMLIVGLYRVGLGLADRVWFQNGEDAVYFESLGICPKSKAIVIRSGGVDTEEYFPGCVDEKQLEILRREFGLSDRDQVVAMSARNNWRKGVREFIEASELCGKIIPQVHFLLMTLEEQNMDAIPSSYLKEKASRVFQWLGRRHDVKEIFALSDVVVLPSYYGEGVPHSLLEAMALGKPIVTTDNVGCREVIEDGTNGFMISPRDSAALAKAITAILADAEMCAEFGRNSRIKAVNEFSDHLVLRRVLSELYVLGDSCTQSDTDGWIDQSSTSNDDSTHQREQETL